MRVNEDTLGVEDSLRPDVNRLEVDLHALAHDGVLLGGETTVKLMRAGGERLQLRALEPPTFEGVDWPADVRERIEEQRARSAAATAHLRRQLSVVVAGTIAGLTLLLVVLVVVLLLA